MRPTSNKPSQWDAAYNGLLLLGIVLLVTLISTYTWWAIEQDKNLTLSHAESQHLLQTRLIEEHLQNALQETSRTLNVAADALASSPAKLLEDEANLRSLLSVQKHDQTYLYALSVIDKQGTIKASSLRFPIEKNSVANLEYVKSLSARENQAQKNVVLGASYQGKAANNKDKTFFPLARNFHSAQQEWQGLVQAEINLQYFQDFYTRLSQDTGAQVSLYDKAGALVISSTAADDDNTNPVDQLNLQNAVTQIIHQKLNTYITAQSRVEENHILSKEAGLATSIKIKEFPLIVTFAKSTKHVLSDWNQRVRQKIIFAALAITLSLIFATLLIMRNRRVRLFQKKNMESENRYRLLFQDAQDGIILINNQYQFLDANPNGLTLLAVDSKKDLKGLGVEEFTADLRYTQPKMAAKKDAEIKKHVDDAFAGVVQKFEWHANRRGKDYFTEVTLSKIQFGQQPIIFCVLRDISQRKHAERMLQEQNQLLQLIGSGETLESVLQSTCQFVEKHSPHWHCGIQLLSEDEKVFTKVVGENFPPMLINQLSHASVIRGNGVWCDAVLDDVPIWIEDIRKNPSMQYITQRKLLSNYHAMGSWPIMGKKGFNLGTFTLFSESTAPLNQSQLNLISIAIDVSSIAIEGKLNEEKAIRLANYDDLTQLPNKFLFGQYLNHALQNADKNDTQFAILKIDLDRFKAINDTFDQTVGDEIVKLVAKRIKETVKEGQTLARVGGDEFMILAERFKRTREVVELAESILHIISHPFLLKNQKILTTASIGISMYPQDGFEDASLIKHAEIAMYRAKENGRNNYQFFDANMHVHTKEKLNYELELHNALDQKEFRVYYQSKVDVATGKIIGAEALVRWQRKPDEILPPGQFISILEEMGLISKLGLQVFETVCQDILKLKETNIAFGRIAVNLAASQFADTDVVKQLHSIAQYWKVPHEHIELEITESMVMNNINQAIQTMGEMKRAGFSLAIDDFGTGYSSLAYLKRFPVDCLKIDRSFVQDIPRNINDTAIVRVIISMAKTLGLKVVAEGVENRIQLETLRVSHCQQYQGYYHSKPLPLDEWISLLMQDNIQK